MENFDLEKFKKYVNTYENQTGHKKYSVKTIIDDFLYGIGICLDEEEFLEKARLHKDYKILLEYSDAEQLDLAILRIRNGYGITECDYELTFRIETESLSRENPHFSDFMKDISAVFKKYENKGIQEGDMDRKGSTYPAALDIVKDTL